MSEEELRQKLQDSIDWTFKVTLGEETSKVVYSYLKDNFDLSKDTVLDEPKKFSDGLKTLFGPGATILLSFIIRNLASTLNIEFKSRFFDEQIEEAKASFNQSG